jgi:hypothetical protein
MGRSFVVVLVACLTTLLAGCSSKVDPPVDTGKAGEVIKTALDAWKQGEAYGSLKKRSPPLTFTDHDWEAGNKLVDYSLGAIELRGRQCHCPVTLSLQDKDGKTDKREVSYVIDTVPSVVIVRDMFKR